MQGDDQSAPLRPTPPKMTLNERGPLTNRVIGRFTAAEVAQFARTGKLPDR